MTQTCPKCNGTMTLDTISSVYRCPDCKHFIQKPYESLEEAEARIRAKGPRPPVRLTHRGEVERRAMVLFENGHDYLWRENAAAAIEQFKRAIEIQPNFADPHLWIAKLTDDETVKRHHLDIILANDMGHPEALRMMMVLNGRLTPEQAAQTYHAESPELRRVDSPVGTKVKALLCPICGGHLTVDDDSKRVYCRFCGHEEALKEDATVGGDVLGMALLERKTQRVKWVIGEHLLHCNQCGAERTIAHKMSLVCPFCGSNNVIEQDALKSFEQPDGLVPFEVSEERAKAAIQERLKTLGERLYMVFDGNKVARATIEGVYLPFWVFDMLLEVSVTTVDKRVYDKDPRWIQFGNTAYNNVKTMDGINGMPICAVKSPPPELTRELGEYDLDTMLPYEPKLLARYPAELYDIDFDDASLEARGRASEQMRNEQLAYKDSQVEMNVSTSVIQMSFSLVLMPVWVATLTERDGDLRTALVNGQNGRVALGKARKPDAAR